MKSIYDCDQNEKMLRALIVIDAMMLLVDECTDGNPTPLQEMASSIYRIAHSAHGICGGCGNDSKWLDEIETQAKNLKTLRTLDLENALAKFDGETKPGMKCRKGILHEGECEKGTK